MRVTSTHLINRTVFIICIMSLNHISKGFVQTVLHRWKPFFRKTDLVQTMTEGYCQKAIYMQLILML